MSNKYLIVYFGIILVISCLLYLFIKTYTKANFSEQRKEQLLSEISKFRYFGENPCTNAILGSPDAQDAYVKLNIYCNGNESSTNTLAVKAINPSSYADLIKLVARINLYEVEVEPKRLVRMGNLVSNEISWRCFINNDEIVDFEKSITPGDNVNCFYR